MIDGFLSRLNRSRPGKTRWQAGVQSDTPRCADPPFVMGKVSPRWQWFYLSFLTCFDKHSDQTMVVVHARYAHDDWPLTTWFGLPCKWENIETHM